MTTEATLNVKVYKNDNVLNNISETIHLDVKNWSNYTKCLKTVQKNVNTYLTELVEQEKNAGDTEQMNVEEEDDSESDEEDENDSIKRKLENASDETKSKKQK